MYKTPREQRQELIRNLLVLILSITILLTIGTFVYHFSEGWSLLDSLYFSTISLTARGFSDMYPTNWFSVLFTVIYLLVGVSLVIYSISMLIAHYISYYQTQVGKKVGEIVGKLRNEKEKKNKWVVLNMKN